jgi:hypothetical protein
MAFVNSLGQNATFNNLTVLGELNLTNPAENIATNLITNLGNTTSIDMNEGGNSIDLNGTSINNYGIVSFSSNLNLNNADAEIVGFGNVSLSTSSNKILYLNNNKSAGGDLHINTDSFSNTYFDAGNMLFSNAFQIQGENYTALTTSSGYQLSLNNGKTSGNLVINSGSTNCNVVISSGNLFMNTIQLNPIQYFITSGMATNWYLSQMTLSYDTTFVVQTNFNSNVNLNLDIATPTSMNLLCISQMSSTYTVFINNQTGQDFYGDIGSGTTAIPLQNNQLVSLKCTAGLWYVTIRT